MAFDAYKILDEREAGSMIDLIAPCMDDYLYDLAAAIRYSTKTVGRIERGDSTPSAEFMLRISKYFNMLVEDVFHVED